MTVEHKSAEKSLEAAMGQLIDYLPSLHRSDAPWLLVVSDFQRFQRHNVTNHSSGAFAPSELPEHVHLLWWNLTDERPSS